MNKRKRTHKQKSSHRRSLGILLGLPLLALAILALVWALRDETTTVTAAGAREGQPLVAVHEMGQGPTIPFLPANEPQPQINLTETTYDFGVIGPKDIVERTFTIRNTGRASLTISRAYTTCGCTTAEISTNVIPPGGEATARLIFDAGFHDAAGQSVRRGLILENNDPQQSQAEIWIQADVSSS